MTDGGRADDPSAGFDLGAALGGIDRTRLALWVVAGVLLLALLAFARRFEATLILALFVYYVTRPVFDRIHTRVHNRTLAVATSLVAVATPVLFLVGWTLVIAIRALADFLTPAGQAQLRDVAGPYFNVSGMPQDGGALVGQLLTDPVGFLQTDLGAVASGALEGVLASVGLVFTAALQAFIVLVLTFYLLRDDYRVASWARRTVVAEGSVVERYLVRVDRELQTVFFGNILNALVTGLIAVLTFLVLNAVAPPVVRIPQPALVGLLVGAASLVPAIGIKLVTVPLGVYLLARSLVLQPDALWFPLVFFAVSFVVVDYIPDQLLRPYVSGRRLHVGAVMLAYLFGPILFGWYGLFLGPFLLVLVFEFGQVVVPFLVDPEAAEPPPTTERDDGGSPASDGPAAPEAGDDADAPGEGGE